LDKLNKIYDLIRKKVKIADINHCSENSYEPGNHKPACKFLDERLLYCDLFDTSTPDYKRCSECIEIFGVGSNKSSTKKSRSTIAKPGRIIRVYEE